VCLGEPLFIASERPGAGYSAAVLAAGKRVAVVVAVAALALAAPALAASHPKTGNYSGTSSSNVANAPPQPFAFSVTHAKCASPGASPANRHKAYCVDIAGGTQLQRQCTDGTYGGAYIPLDTAIALSSRGSTSFTYTVYSDAGGQLSVFPATGETMVGTFALALNVTAKGTASGSMTYNVSGCTSNGAELIKAKRA
jgi:hypothetical protein